MEAVFLKVLDMSITAGYIIAAVILLRLIFRKMPAWAKCALWGIAALRLVCPFSVESIFSLVPETQTVPATVVRNAFPQNNAIISDTVSTSAANTAAQTSGRTDVTAVIAAVWLMGMAAMVLYGIISYITVRYRICDAVRLEDNILQSEKASSPFILGFLRSKIYNSL